MSSRPRFTSVLALWLGASTATTAVAQTPQPESPPATAPVASTPAEAPAPTPPSTGAPASQLPPAAPLPPADAPLPETMQPVRVQEVTVVGTREKQTAGSAHILKPATLERFKQDNPEAVLKAVPGVYSRGEDGIGLRPNLGLRGVNPERSKKVTLMEDGVLFGPAPYSAPAAYYFPLVTRMESVRVIKGPGAVSFGPQTIAGAVDFISRRIPPSEAGQLDLAGGQFGYGKMHGYYGANNRTQGFLIEGLHLRSDGFKELDGGATDTGFDRNEWMVKARRVLGGGGSLFQELGLKLVYSDEDSRETYLGLSDDDFRANPLRRYRASQFDRMQNHRASGTIRYLLDFGGGRSVETTAYRHQYSRTWRKVNRFGNKAIADVLANPTSAQNAIYMGVLRGELNSSGGGDTIFIGPNHRTFVSQGLQSVANLRFRGAIEHRLEIGGRLHYDRIDRLHSEDGFLMRLGQLVPDGRPTLVTSNERVWTLAGALWAADAMTWKALTLTPGVRTEIIAGHSRNRLSGQEIDSDVQSVVIPGVGAYAALTSSFGLLAGAYRGFSPAASGQAGDVQPERSWNYEAGARFATRNARIEAIGFLNDYSNLTSNCSFSSGCDDRNLDRQFNAGDARIWGAEAFAQADIQIAPGYLLPLSSAYTLTRTKLLNDFLSEDPQLGNVRAGDEMPYVPRHQLTASLGIESDRFGVFGEVTYVSAMRERAGQEDDPNEPKTDDSLVANASARLRVAGPLWAYLQLRNVFNAVDVASRRPFGARPTAPRWVQLGLKAGF